MDRPDLVGQQRVGCAGPLEVPDTGLGLGQWVGEGKGPSQIVGSVGVDLQAVGPGKGVGF